MTINFENNTIEMTKAEAKEAGKFNSEKYLELKEIRAEFPTFRIVTKAAPKKNNTYKGLTYLYMEQYIETHAKDDGKIKSEFEQLVGREEGKKKNFTETAKYGEVKAWFLETFTEFVEFNKKTAELREGRKERAEMKKVEKMMA